MNEAEEYKGELRDVWNGIIKFINQPNLNLTQKKVFKLDLKHYGYLREICAVKTLLNELKQDFSKEEIIERLEFLLENEEELEREE